jgi:hypothetical protein
MQKRDERGQGLRALLIAPSGLGQTRAPSNIAPRLFIVVPEPRLGPKERLLGRTASLTRTADWDCSLST